MYERSRYELLLKQSRVRFHLLKIHLLLPYLYFYLFVCQRMNMPSSPRYQTTKTLGITSIYWLIWWKQTSYSSTHTDLRVYSKYYVLGILSSPPLRAKPTVHAIDSVKTIDAIVVTWYPSQKIMNNWFYSVKNYFYNKITKFLSLGTQPNIAESVQMVYGISSSAWLSPQNAIVSRPNFSLYKY